MTSNTEQYIDHEQSTIKFCSDTTTLLLNNTDKLRDRIVLFSGSTPYSNSDMAQFLPPWIMHFDLASGIPEKAEEYSDALLVVGSDSWDTDEIEEIIETYGRQIWVLPQEGFLDLILFGFNWWNNPIR